MPLVHSPEVKRFPRTNAGTPPDQLGFHRASLVTDSTLNADRFYIPFTYKEAIASPDGIQWREAMIEEMASLEVLNTWEQFELPKTRKCAKKK